MPLSIKTQNDSFLFEHELKTEIHDDYEYVKSLEKEVDELESEKTDFSNIYDLLLEECVSKDVTCSYLHSLSDLNAYAELQCLYLHKVKECECLAQKFSKQTKSVNKENKKPNVVPISARNPRVYYKELYENTNQDMEMVVAKKCPSGVLHGHKKASLGTKKIWMPKIQEEIVQLILFIVDSGCTKHMTGNLKLLCNFVEKFLGTVHFGNDQFAPILGYGDLNPRKFH
ncbi:hypothetical protein Tco_0651995 [Tanacetum coccineum]|uniref:Retrovirus-related Pol polyprotein from transposon TNT 1-94-like beta-barrel domain-containing protein n=1 Tax=Tanacetum coccineum TaxID=301880 RepID=A0ABQ4WX14_9ASTR